MTTATREARPTGGSKRVVVIGGLAKSLVVFRGHLLQSIVDAGHETYACAPDRSEPVEQVLATMGVQFRQIPLDRTGTSIRSDGQTLAALVRLLRELRPDVVFCYALKPVVYGSLAARIARVPERYALVTGLGYTFIEGNSRSRRLLGALVRNLYRLALSGVHTAIFQNPDDRELFRQLRILRRTARTAIVNGSGVDTREFAPRPFPEGPTTFLLIARLLRDKGIREYAGAARRVKQIVPSVRVQLLGPYDPHPNAISPDEVAQWEREGTLEYLGETEDVRPYIAGAHVYVLPSYREGTPRSVLEAMAMGRPIITTDVPGCRETTIHDKNGLLVPPRDEEALASAMLELARKPELIATMGHESRRIAETKYDVRAVTAELMAITGLTSRSERRQ